jgi:hypothetical protein
MKIDSGVLPGDVLVHPRQLMPVKGMEYMRNLEGPRPIERNKCS